MIKVVHITENPIAGAPMNLCAVLNKYQGTEVSCRHIAQSDRNDNRIFRSDIIIDAVPYELLRNTLLEADVLHFHNFYRNQHLFRKYPDLWKIAMTKKKVWQVHSQRDTVWVDLEEGLRDKTAKHLVIGQYHPRQWPECQVVPNVIDIFDPNLMPDFSVKNEIPRVVFSPSRIGLKGWDNKGYYETLPALQELVDRRQITAEIIFNQTHEVCLQKRKKADIAIDEIVTGSYHLCSLESLSAGLVTIAGLDEVQIRTLKDLTGASELPWVVAKPESIRQVLSDMTSPANIQNGALQAVKQLSRQWMEKYWHPVIMAHKFVEVYKSL